MPKLSTESQYAITFGNYPRKASSATPRNPQKEPFKCPVCQGRCHMPSWYYSANLYPQWTDVSAIYNVPCRSCGGNGIVWEPQGESK